MALFSIHMTASEKKEEIKPVEQNLEGYLHSRDASTIEMKVFFIMPIFIKLIKPKGKKTIGNSMLPF